MDDNTKDIILTYEKKEKEAIKKLWDESFHDPDSFSDFYFENIYCKNKVLTAWYRDELVGMVHLNPYNISYMGNEELCYYIVGVAVRYDMQGQGIMKKMLNKVKDDIKSESSFAFLMPKKQEYYNSLGFRMVYNTRLLDYSIIDSDEFGRDVFDNYSALMLNITHLSQIQEKEYDKLSFEINDIMKKQYNAFSLRNKEYLIEMLKEHTCQNGDVCIVNETMAEGDNVYDNLVGIFAYDVYDEVMYVERFEPFADNMVALLIAVMKQAIEITCDRCIITVAGNDLEDISHLVSGVEIDISNGNGIMAVSLDATNDKIFENLEEKCFFDEIV